MVAADLPATAAPTAAPAIEVVLAEYAGALRRVAATYAADRAGQDDLLQEIAVALWQSLPRFRGECSLRGFVLRVAHNRGITHSLRRPPRGEGLDEVAQRLPASPAHDPVRAIDDDRRLAALWRAIRTLPPLLREVLTLHLEGLSGREIADVVGISETNVNVRLTRARAALRAALREDQ